MPSEILSTVRPTTLRLAGFLCLAAGAVLAGVGATGEWAAIGFPGDLEHAADASVHGTDVWEGKVVLLAAAIALFALLAMRLSRSGKARLWIAVLLTALGIACAALPAMDAARGRDRFGGEAGTDLYVSWLASQLELPEEVIRDQFAQEFERALRVDIAPSVWVTAMGGVLVIAGGILSVAWTRRRGAAPGSAGDGRG